MSNSVKSPLRANYYPATLHKGKEWYISYYAENIYTGHMQRFRIKVNRIKSIKEREQYCRNLLRELNNKLHNGWSPYADDSSPRMFVPLMEAIRIYKEAKFRELEPHSVRSYNYFLQRFTLWLEAKHKNIYAGDFGARYAADFMLYVRSLRGVSARTYNNHLIFYRAMFAWLVKFDYVPDNHFAGIDKLKKIAEKKRRPLTMQEMHRLIEWCRHNNERYLAMVMLSYYCFLRPDDLAVMQLGQIDMNSKLIYIEGTQTKNQKSSYRVIPEALEEYLVCLFAVDTTDKYLFSGRNFTPGNKPGDARSFAKYWANKIRPALGFGLELQFYSIKDTGITNMLADGISPGYVQGQADHSSLEVTEKYIHTHTPEGFEAIRQKARRF